MQGFKWIRTWEDPKLSNRDLEAWRSNQRFKIQTLRNRFPGVSGGSSAAVLQPDPIQTRPRHQQRSGEVFKSFREATWQGESGNSKFLCFTDRLHRPPPIAAITTSTSTWSDPPPPSRRHRQGEEPTERVAEAEGERDELKEPEEEEDGAGELRSVSVLSLS